MSIGSCYSPGLVTRENTNGMVLAQFWLKPSQVDWLLARSQELIQTGKLVGTGRTRNLGPVGGKSELVRRLIEIGMSKPKLVERLK